MKSKKLQVIVFIIALMMLSVPLFAQMRSNIESALLIDSNNDGRIDAIDVYINHSIDDNLTDFDGLNDQIEAALVDPSVESLIDDFTFTEDIYIIGVSTGSIASDNIFRLDIEPVDATNFTPTIIGYTSDPDRRIVTPGSPDGYLLSFQNQSILDGAKPVLKEIDVEYSGEYVDEIHLTFTEPMRTENRTGGIFIDGFTLPATGTWIVENDERRTLKLEGLAVDEQTSAFYHDVSFGSTNIRDIAGNRVNTEGEYYVEKAMRLARENITVAFAENEITSDIADETIIETTVDYTDIDMSYIPEDLLVDAWLTADPALPENTQIAIAYNGTPIDTYNVGPGGLNEIWLSEMLPGDRTALIGHDGLEDVWTFTITDLTDDFGDSIEGYQTNDYDFTVTSYYGFDFANPSKVYDNSLDNIEATDALTIIFNDRDTAAQIAADGINAIGEAVILDDGVDAYYLFEDITQTELTDIQADIQFALDLDADYADIDAYVTVEYKNLAEPILAEHVMHDNAMVVDTYETVSILEQAQYIRVEDVLIEGIRIPFDEDLTGFTAAFMQTGVTIDSMPYLYIEDGISYYGVLEHVDFSATTVLENYVYLNDSWYYFDIQIEANSVIEEIYLNGIAPEDLKYSKSIFETSSLHAINAQDNALDMKAELEYRWIILGLDRDDYDTFSEEKQLDVAQIMVDRRNFDTANTQHIQDEFLNAVALADAMDLTYYSSFVADDIVTYPDEGGFAVETTYPSEFLSGLSPDLKVDAALLSNNKDIPEGSEIDLIYNGSSLGIYTVGADTDFLWLSEMLNDIDPLLPTRTPLIGHEGLIENWEFDITVPFLVDPGYGQFDMIIGTFVSYDFVMMPGNLWLLEEQEFTMEFETVGLDVTIDIPEEFRKEIPGEFSYTIDFANSYDGFDAYAQFSGDMDDIDELKYWDGADWIEIPDPFEFAIEDDLAFEFKATFDPGIAAIYPVDYDITFTIYRDEGDIELYSTEDNFVVDYEPMEVVSDLPEYFLEGDEDWTEFSVATIPNDDAGKMVRAWFEIPAEAEVEYLEQNPSSPNYGEWLPLTTGYYGPETGFPVVDNTADPSMFRAKFDTAGYYEVDIEFRRIDPEEVLAEHTLEIDVYKHSTYAFDYDMPELILEAENTEVPVTFATDELAELGYEGVRFKFFKVDGPGDVTFTATDSAGDTYTFTNTGYWGPPSGFELPADYTATTDWTLNFSEIGTYEITFQLIYADTEEVITEDSQPDIEVERYSTYAFDYTAPELIVATEEIEVPVNFATDVLGTIGYDDVRFKFFSDTPGVTFEATDSHGTPHTFIDEGYWGPAEGFDLPANYDETTDWKLTFDGADDYTITYQLIYADTEDVIVEESETFTVDERSTYAFDYSAPDNIYEALNIVVPVTFATDYEGTIGYDGVRFKFFSDTPGVTFEATDSEGTVHTFTDDGYWGPAQGFDLPAIYEETTDWTIKFDNEGTYNITYQLIYADGEEVIVEESDEFVVNPFFDIFTSITIDPDDAGNYGINSEFTMEFTFAEDMTIVGDDPIFNLNVNGTEAIYVSGDGTDTFTFDYIVAMDDEADPLTITDFVGVVADQYGNEIDLSTIAPIDIGHDGFAGIVVDGVPPRIQEITTEVASGVYSHGDQIAFKVVYDKIVTVNWQQGTPRINLNSGGYAEYISGSGHSSGILTFRYIIGEDDNTPTDGYLKALPPLEQRGGTIRAQAAPYNIATNDFDETEFGKSIVISNDPRIVDVTYPDPGYYGIGDEVDFLVEYNKDIVVTGTPLLELNSGEYAEYVEGTLTDVLTFRYIVEEDDDFVGLDYASIDAIDLNGGSTNDVHGVEADNTLPEPSAEGVVIDGIEPVPTITWLGNDGEIINVEIQFSEEIADDLIADDLVVTNGVVDNFVADEQVYTFELTVVDYSAAAPTVTVPIGAVQDLAGNDNVEAFETFAMGAVIAGTNMHLDAVDNVVTATMNYPFIEASLQDFMLDAIITSVDPFAAGTEINVVYNGTDLTTAVLTEATSEIYLSDLLEGDPTPLVGHSELTDIWELTIASPVSVDNQITVTSVTSDDEFATMFDLAEDTADLQFIADEDLAIAAAVAGTDMTLVVEDNAVTAEISYPEAIDVVLADYIMDAQIYADPDFPAGTEIDIYYNDNHITTAELADITGNIYLSELIGDAGDTRTPLVGHAGRTDNWMFVITSAYAFDTDLTVESVTSKDDFLTEEILADGMIEVNVAADEDAALEEVIANTDMNMQLADNEATFDITYPDVIDPVLSAYMVDAWITADLPFVAGTQIGIEYNGNEVTTATLEAETDEIYLSELIGEAAQTRTPLVDHAGLVDNWVISVTSPISFETELTVQSVVSNDEFTTQHILDEIVGLLNINADEDMALQQVVDNTEMLLEAEDNIVDATITYPAAIEDVLADYMMDAYITSDEALVAGTEIEIYYNEAYLTTHVLADDCTEMYLSELIGNAAQTRTPLITHAGLIDEWSFVINSAVVFDTELTIQSVTSDDDFVTQTVLAEGTVNVNNLEEMAILAAIEAINLLGDAIYLNDQSRSAPDFSLFPSATHDMLVDAQDLVAAARDLGNPEDIDAAINEGITTVFANWEEVITVEIVMSDGAQAVEIHGVEAGEVALYDNGIEIELIPDLTGYNHAYQQYGELGENGMISHTDFVVGNVNQIPSETIAGSYMMFVQKDLNPVRSRTVRSEEVDWYLYKWSIVYDEDVIDQIYLNYDPEDPEDPVYQRVRSVELPESLTIYEGPDTFEMEATVSPEGATIPDIVWESDDETIVTVDNGILTPIAKGSANITITSLDGGHTATSLVNVGIAYGDVDNNQVVEAYDAALTLQHAVGMDPLPNVDPRPWSDWRFNRADVDGNNNIQAYDASLILQYALGIINQFPAESRAIQRRVVQTASGPHIGIELIDDMIAVYTDEPENLFGLDISIENNEFVTFGDVQFNLPDNYLTATHQDNDNMNISIATAIPETLEDTLFLIPFSSTENTTLNISITSNTTTMEYELDLLPLSSEDPLVPLVNAVESNYPNPFNPSTTIKYSVKETSPVRIHIYNIKGQLVDTLVDEVKDAGYHSVQWNGVDRNGRSVASGMYFYMVSIGNEFRKTQKMMLLK